MAPGRWGRGRGEWPRPPLAPGSRPSLGSQSGSSAPPSRPPLASRPPPLPGRAGSPGAAPGADLPTPAAPAPFPASPPSPTSGAGCALRARGSLGEPPCPPTAEGDLMLDCFLRGHRFPSFSGPPPPKPSRVPGAEFTYSRSSPGFHYFGDFLTLHIEKATDLIPVSYPPSLP